MNLKLLLALANLRENEREVVIDHYLLGRSYREIGGSIGCSAERTRNIGDRALRRLRGLMAP